MRTGASLGWRIATAVAFGATAALAVILSRGAPMNAALTAVKGAAARHTPVTTRCAASGLRISLGPGTRANTAISRYPLDFTNVSGAPCTLVGYPEVSAYRGDGVQVGADAGRDQSAPALSVLLAPGQTAHATVDAALPATRCGPVRATGLRVVAPGQAAARYVRRPLTVCTARAARGQDYLRASAIQSGAGQPGGGQPGTGAPIGIVANFKPSPVPACSARPACSGWPAHPAKQASRHVS